MIGIWRGMGSIWWGWRSEMGEWRREWGVRLLRVGKAFRQLLRHRDDLLTPRDPRAPLRRNRVHAVVRARYLSVDGAGGVGVITQVHGGEQMYQALLLLGVPSGMVVSPRQFHGISRPSFVKDRCDRYLAWYGKYLMGVAQ